MSAGDEARGRMRCERLAGRVKEEFEELMRIPRRATEAFPPIKPWLPAKVEALLDIGCGLGGIDIYLARHYDPVTVHLMDGDGKIENRAVGFLQGTQAWADVRVAEDLVRDNVPASCVVVSHVADPSLTLPVDLIVSLKSWAHHYPAKVYMGLAKRSLRPGGRIIVDVRKNTDGEAAFNKAGFKRVGRVAENKKCERLVFER